MNTSVILLKSNGGSGMNYASIKEIDIANGTGCRVSLFVSGCPHHCKGCFNEVTWSYDYGELYTKEVEDKIIKLLEPNYISGLSLLGGEPGTIPHILDLGSLIKRTKELYPEKDIWMYSGYLYDDIVKAAKNCPQYFDIVKNIDVLVDGRFVEELKDITLKFRGSSNQRIIELKKSFENNEIVLHRFMKEEKR